MNRLLNISEFAQELGITKACVRRWILERKINHLKIGRLIRFHPSEARRIVEASLRPAKPER